MVRDEAGPEQSIAGAEGMLRQATTMAGRLAAGRSARPLVFVSERPADLRSTLLWMGGQLSTQGCRTVLIEDPESALGKISDALAATSDGPEAPQVAVRLVPAINVLGQPALAALLDALHLAARSRDTLGCIAVGRPDNRATLGNSIGSACAGSRREISPTSCAKPAYRRQAGAQKGWWSFWPRRSAFVNSDPAAALGSSDLLARPTGRTA